MTRATMLPLLIMATHSLPAAAQDVPTVEALWEIVQAQQAQIDALKAQLAATESTVEQASNRIEQTEQMVVATADYIEDLEVPDPRASRTRIGGYGEVHYNNLSADDPARDLEEVDFHRFVLFFGHEFSDRVSFFSELELEHSVAGDGKPGEMELEQAYLNFALNNLPQLPAVLNS